MICVRQVEVFVPAGGNIFSGGCVFRSVNFFSKATISNPKKCVIAVREGFCAVRDGFVQCEKL